MASIRGSFLYLPQMSVTDITLAKNDAMDLWRWIRMWEIVSAVAEMISLPMKPFKKII